jgi:hypothetical protein
VTAKEVPEERLFETVPIQKLVMGFDVVFSFLGNACTHIQSHWSTSSEKTHSSAIREGRVIIFVSVLISFETSFFIRAEQGGLHVFSWRLDPFALHMSGEGHKSSGNQVF